MLLLFALIVGSMNVWAADETFNLSYSNGTAVTTVNGTDATLTFSKGTGSNAPTYYTASPTGVRLYGGGTLTVSSTTKQIISVVFTFGSKSAGGFSISATNATTVTTGSSPVTFNCPNGASSVEFKNTGSSGNYAFTKVEVTFATTKTTPVLSFGESSYDATVGQSFAKPTLNNTGDVIESGSLSYDSSVKSVATVDNEGNITLLSAGTTVITATAAETNTQNEATASYTLNVAASSVSAPIIDKANGEYAYNTAVTITTTESDILYTTDGTDPYSSPTAVDANGTSAVVYITGDMTLTAISLDGSLNASAPIVREYTVIKPEAPSFSPVAGSFVGAQTVTITSPAGTTISYTTDSSDPASSGTALLTDGNSAVVNVTTTTTIRAITIDANAIQSAEATALYTIIIPKDLPYSETFKTSNGLGDFTTDNTSVWTASTSYGAVAQSGSATAWLISPVISLIGIQGAALNFSQATNKVGNLTTDATVWVKEVDGNWTQLTPLTYSDNNSWTYVDNTLDLSTYIGKNIQIGFKYAGTNSNGKWEVTDFSVVEVLPDPTFTLSPTETTLTMGNTETVDITLTTNTDGVISCESDDEDVATVALKSAGVYTITAKTAGTAIITISAAASANYKAASATVDVTVQDNRLEAPISFAENSQETTLGETYTGQALTNANSLPVTYSSTDESVATVAADGIVTVVAAGTTTIKATFAGNATYKKTIVSYTLTVNKKDSEIAWSTDAAEAKLGRTFVAPTLSNPHDLSVTYSIDYQYVAEIDATSGEITIVDEGTCTVKATFAGDDEYASKVASYALTVVDPDKTVINFNNNDQNIDGSFEQENELTYTIKGVGFVFTKTGNENQPRVDGAEYTSSKVARVYAGNTMTMTAPDGVNFKEIKFNIKEGSLKIGSTAYNNGSKWTGSAHSVTFTGNVKCFINSISIYYDTENVTVGESGYATYCSTKDLDFSTTDVKAYTAKVDGGVVKLTKVANDIVPANTGVVLFCETPDTYAIPVTTTEATVSDNEMVGVTVRTQVNETTGTKYNYILQSGSFNNANGGYLKANRAYLSTTYQAPVIGGARSLQIVFDEEATGIAEMETVKNVENGKFYNLNGQQVAQPTKGLYIVGGRKVVVK